MNPAPTYEMIDHRGLRLRCTACHKVVKRDEEHARTRAAEITAQGTPMKAYRGRCGNWHLSSNVSWRRRY